MNKSKTPSYHVVNVNGRNLVVKVSYINGKKTVEVFAVGRP